MVGIPLMCSGTVLGDLADTDRKSLYGRLERVDVHLLRVDDICSVSEFLEGKVIEMTIMEKMQTCSKEELAKILCRIVEDTADGFVDDDFCCDACVAKEFCSKGHNGFLDWLDRKVAVG